MKNPPSSRTVAIVSDRLAQLWVLGMALTLFWLFWDHGYDDPYITYRYAVNLAQGQGFVYNVAERVLSTTTPLYTFLLAGASLAGLAVPVASNAIGCVSLALGGWAIWKLGQAWRAPLVGVAGLLLYPTFPLVVSTLGAETALYIAFILCGFLACAQERYSRAAVLLALAALTRADGVLAATAAGIYVLLVARPRPWGAAAIYCALLLPWFVFAWIYFGALFPVTLAAKQQQGSMAISRSFWGGLLGQAQGYWSNIPYRPHFVLATVGLLYALARQRRWLLLAGWTMLYAAGYVALGVSGYFWYYAPLMAGLIALVGLGVMAVYWLIERRVGSRWATGVSAALLLVLLAAQLGSLASLRYQTDLRVPIYRAVGEWLRRSTPPDASVGALEIGVIGYYAQRRMIDFAGLIQPETALHLTTNTTYQDAALWAVHHFHPDYLVLHEHLFTDLEADSAITTSCHIVEILAQPGYANRLTIYQCIW